jgi:hypothetical protein
MLRCDVCGGRAVAALGHVHGLVASLCVECTGKAVASQGEAQKVSLLVATAKVSATQKHLSAQMDRRNYFGDHYHGPSLDEIQVA